MSILMSMRDLLGRPVDNFESLIVDGSVAKAAIAVSSSTVLASRRDF